jgi:hypothetical protein
MTPKSIQGTLNHVNSTQIARVPGRRKEPFSAVGFQILPKGSNLGVRNIPGARALQSSDALQPDSLVRKRDWVVVVNVSISYSAASTFSFLLNHPSLEHL